MIPLSPALLIASAFARLSGRTTFSCTRDREHRLRSPRLPAPDDEAASIGFINGVGFWAHFDVDTGESSWPLPHLQTVTELATFGRNQRILFARPRLGDLAVTWNATLNRFTRAAIVASIITANDDGSLCRILGAHCDGARARKERFARASGDRFLRWIDLDERRLLARAA